MFKSHPVNLSRKWPSRTSLEIVADLTNGTLNGVSLGSPFAALRFLGPTKKFSSLGVCSCDDDESLKDSIYGNYDYLPDGLSLDANESNCLDSFELHFVRSEDFKGKVYAGKLVFNARAFSAHEVRTRAEVERNFGAPKLFERRENVARSLRYSFSDYVFATHICTVTYDENENVDGISCAVRTTAWDRF